MLSASVTQIQKQPYPHSVLETESFTSDGSQGVAVYGEEWMGWLYLRWQNWLVLIATSPAMFRSSKRSSSTFNPDIPMVSVREINHVIINQWLPNQD